MIDHLDGPEEFVDWKSSLIQNITSQDGGSVYVPESDIDNVGRIFSNRLSYNKGAMVVEMLRWKIGDTNFFQGVRNYLADPNLAYDFAVTADLQSHLEAASGMDLDEFFADWIYGQGYPSYDITAQNIAAGQVQFTINQVQSHPSVSFYEMPLPIRVYGSAGEQLDVVLQNTANNQTLVASVPFPIVGFDFDPERHLISAENATTLGVDYLTAEAIDLYPNPASDVLQISIPTSVTFEKAIFYNNLGQVVLQSTSQSIDVESLATGVHFIKLVTSEGTFNKKFIKK